MSKLINIAHELPYILERSEDLQYEVIPKSHIFASGLDGFYKEQKSIWFGRPGMNKGDVSKNERERLEKEFHKNNCYPIYLPKKEHGKFLDGFRVRKGRSNVLTNAPYVTDIHSTTLNTCTKFFLVIYQPFLVIIIQFIIDWLNHLFPIRFNRN